VTKGRTSARGAHDREPARGREEQRRRRQRRYYRNPLTLIPLDHATRIVAFGSAAARLMRAYATQVEVLRRLRSGGHQFVRVEHVHVNDGGQAVIGNVKQSDA
jgi:hypothetical protein